MIASLLARYAGRGEREVDRYAAWIAALRRLREDWAAGERPAAGGLSEFARGVPDEHRAEAAEDLVAEHLRLAWASGRGPLLESSGPADLPVDLIEDEFLARHQLPHGDTPSPEEYERRFPSRPEVLARLRARLLDGDRFVKLRLRGLGAMGAVWEAHDRQSGGRVAIKEPRRDLDNPADALRRFSAEARVTGALDHPGIVAMREVRPADGGAPFFVMRLVEGRTLGEHIREVHVPPLGREPREQRAGERRLLEMFGQICGAVAHAHAQGVLHRDLTPANVMVDESGGVALLDWELARPLVEEGDCSGEVVGTPDYMPPEQADGRAGVRSDVFGLGAILHEILAGRSPHGWADGARPADWLELVRRAEFARPSAAGARVPRAIEEVCVKALSRDPARRYASPVELGEDVRRYLAGEPVSAWVEPALIRGWRRLWAGR